MNQKIMGGRSLKGLSGKQTKKRNVLCYVVHIQSIQRGKSSHQKLDAHPNINYAKISFIWKNMGQTFKNI